MAHHLASWNLVKIGSGDGLPPDGCQAITLTIADLLSFEPLETVKFNLNSIVLFEENVFENTVCKISTFLF